MKNIGVVGCLPELPSEFPLYMPENSGNMIHATAPLLMFENAVHSKNPIFKITGEKSFRSYVNNTCSHVIITLANTLKVGCDNNEKYLRLRKSLEQYNVPIIVFGLGIQDIERDLSKATLCEEAIKLIQFLSKSAAMLGVRGEYTKKVIEKCCNVQNVFVTGCPSLFSDVEGLKLLHRNLQNNISGKPAINVTNLNRESERDLLFRAIEEEHLFVEPVSKFSHEYHLQLVRGDQDISIPYFLKKMQKSDSLELLKVEKFYKENYRLFRNIQSWKQFNKEYVSCSYGTRFHVNMASILSGKPALWLTHDARTSELTEFFNLPSLSLDIAVNKTISELIEYMNYEEFFIKLPHLFDNFNEYLSLNGLPNILSFKN